MRSTHHFILRFLLVFGLGVAQAATPGDRAPDFALKSFTGKNLRLSEYRGDVVVLTFWASWCSDCRSQLSELSELSASHHDAGLRVLTVSMDRNTSSLQEDVVSMALGYPFLDDATLEVSKLYDVESLPVSLIIDREGVLREVVEGHDRDARERVTEVLESLLTE